MWQRPFTLALLIICFASANAAQASPSSSVSDYQRAYSKAYPNQKYFDEANIPMPAQQQLAEPMQLAPDAHAGKIADRNRQPVDLQAPPQNATQAQDGMFAGNPPTATLFGLTELKYPMQKASHFGPPMYYEYEYLFRYQEPPTMIGGMNGNKNSGNDKSGSADRGLSGANAVGAFKQGAAGATSGMDVGGCFGSQAAATAAFRGMPITFGIPITDSADYINKMTLNAKLVDQITEPSRWLKVTEAWNQAQQQDMANANAQAAEVAFAGSITDMHGALFNLANEEGVKKPTGKGRTRTIQEVAWMVQAAYKQIYIPIAILLVLPGAVLTQIRAVVGYGFKLNVETVSPFQGMLRALIAIFLIPATQLIVSYSIDVGNAMTAVVASYGMDPIAIMNYANAELYDVPFKNSQNQLTPPWTNATGRDPALEDKVVFDINNLWSKILEGFSKWIGSVLSWFGFGGGSGDGGGSIPGIGGGGSALGGSKVDGSPAVEKPNPLARGKATAAPEEESQLETQSLMTTQMQFAYNAINMLNCSVVSVLLEFQTVMMCYLLLLGPIAAALYAWPPTPPFKNTFVSWVNGVVQLTMWRFWWCLILLCMNVRINWLADNNEYHINSEWETVVFFAFSVLMSAVPLQPFNFRPGEFVKETLAKAQENADKAQKQHGASSQQNVDKYEQSSTTGSRNDGSDGEHSRISESNTSPEVSPPPGKDEDSGGSGSDSSAPKAPPMTMTPPAQQESAPNQQVASRAPSTAGTPEGITPPPMTGKTTEV